MINLHYTVEKADTNNYLIYLSNKEELSLSDTLIQSLESFAFYNDSNDSPEAHICSWLQGRFECGWDYDAYGIPSVTLSTAKTTKGIDQLFLKRPIFIFFSRGKLEEEKELWINTLKNVPKFVFTAENTESTIGISTTEHLYVYGYLDCLKHYHPVSVTGVADKTITVMKQWFGNDYERIYNKCKQQIDKFVFTHKYDIRIPFFMIIESDWVRRYQKACRILNDREKPLFIMPIPTVIDNKNYTILLPIMDQLTRSTYKGL